MYIDFHTHILPDIDDGAEDIETSLSMLGLAYECGAEAVVLTPHVSSDADFDNFLDKRNESLSALKTAIEKNPHHYPNLITGAEVALNGPLSEKENVRSLCIEGTDLLLLELPYTSWASWYNNEIYNLISKHKVTPIMAHIERYLKGPKDVDKLSTLVSFGVKFQINASSFLSFKERHIIRRLAAEGLISAIGSDCHNMSNRSPDVTKAFRLFEKKFDDYFIEHIFNKTVELMNKCKL